MGGARRKFVDKVRVLAVGGHGGHGRSSFTQQPHQTMVAADGGRGGDGGSVVAEACAEVGSLELGGKRTFEAEDGEPGGSSNLSGRAGKNLVVQVPIGTVITRLVEKSDASSESASESGSSVQEKIAPLSLHRVDKVIAELNAAGQRAIIAEGGRGGLGNRSYKSSVNRSPFARAGERGEMARLEFELKSIADVGLVGLPNAGKSTLLTAISAARPKTAPYPFTTLHPILGVVQPFDFLPKNAVSNSTASATPLSKTSEAALADPASAQPTPPGTSEARALNVGNDAQAASHQMAECWELENIPRFTVADIPGIIDGSHEDRGLGLGFLRHIERTSVLVYIVEMSDSAHAGRKALEELELLHRELELYQPGLNAARESVVVLNKMDRAIRALGADALRKELSTVVAAVSQTHRVEVFPLSARCRLGVNELVLALWRLILRQRDAAKLPSSEELSLQLAAQRIRERPSPFVARDVDAAELFQSR